MYQNSLSSRFMRLAWVSTLFSLGTLALSSSTQATPNFLNEWQSTYPHSTSALNLKSACNLCHAGNPSNNDHNGYGMDFKQQGYSFSAIESLNSDNDPHDASNLFEIDANTQPGWSDGANNRINGGAVSSTETPAEIIGGTLDPRIISLASEPSQSFHEDNPFTGADGYINPDYRAKVMSEAHSIGGTLGAGMARVANYSTAIWMDRIAAIEGDGEKLGLRAHLEEALKQQNGDTPLTIMVVIYDLPNRDCKASASNGELLIANNGLSNYKTQYIDPIAEILSDPKYSSLRIVAVVEPDSLPNLVTNLDVPSCAEANSSGAYVDGIRYAINELHPIDNVYIYLDIAHSGWLGWESNFTPAVTLYKDMLQGTNDGLNSIDGFITNTANYTPIDEVYLPNSNLNIGAPIKSADFYEWNPYFDEKDFAIALRTALINAGLPSTIGMLIDTSRNGWGGALRPDGVSNSSDLNTYVNESRIDRRPHRGGWCNQQGSGIGARPQASPAPGIDAYVWVKPPGESDGVSASGISDPNDPAKKFDLMCDPNGQSTYDSSYPTNAMADAPHAGRWFSNQFRMLVENSEPPLVGDDILPDMLCDSNDDGKVGIEEAIYALQIAANLKSAGDAVCDINDDGQTGLEETIYALQISAGRDLPPNL